MGAEEDLSFNVNWRQGATDAASDTVGRIDKISDALSRMQLQAAAAQAQLDAVSAMGLFNMPRPGSGNDPIQLGQGNDPNLFFSGIANVVKDAERLKLSIQEVDHYMSGLTDLDRYMSGETENQFGWWQRIRNMLAGDIAGTLRTIIESLGDFFSSGPMTRVPVLGAGFGQIGAYLEEMGTAGAAALPALAAILAVIVAMAAAIASLVSWILVMTATLVAATTVVVTFLGATVGTVALLLGLGGAFVALAAGIVYWGVALQGGVGAATTLTTATKALNTAQEQLDASQLAIAKFYANNPHGPQTQSQVLTLQGLTDRLRDSQANLANAQTNYNQAVTNSQSPMQTLMGTLDGISQQLEPIATQISNTALIWVDAWAQKMGPSVVDTGQKVMDWVGARIPGALTWVAQALNQLGPTFTAFGNFVGTSIDKAFGSAQKTGFLDWLTVGGVKAAVNTIEWLVTQLLRLSDWWEGKLPDGRRRFEEYGAIVGQIFGGIASVATGTLLPALGRFADWLITNWPSISENFSKAIKSISDAWQTLGPIVNWFIQQLLPPLLDDIKQLANNSGGWMTILSALFVILLGGATVLFGFLNMVNNIATAFANAVGAVRDFFAPIGDMSAWQTMLTQWENIVIGAINNVIAALDRIPGIHIGQIPLITSTPPSGSTPGGSTGGGIASRNTGGINITNHINGAQSPAATAAAVNGTLRKLLSLN